MQHPIMLERVNPDLAHRVEALIQETRNLQASTSEQRLLFVSQHFEKLTVEGTYQLLNPDTFQQEVEEAQSHKADIWYASYGLLAFLCLLWLLFSISFATYQYQQMLVKYPGDSIQPFLLLWLNGFHGTSPLTLTITAIIGCILAAASAGCLLQTQWLKRKAHRIAAKFASKLQNITGEMIETVANNAAPLTPEGNINAINRIIDKAVLANQQITKQAEANIGRMNQGIDRAFAANQQVTEQAKQFIKDSQDQTQAALNNISELSNSLDQATKRMDASSSGLAQNTDKSLQITQELNYQMKEANETQQQVNHELQQIVQVQKMATDQMARLNKDQQQAFMQLANMMDKNLYQLSSVQKNAVDQMAHMTDDQTQAVRQLEEMTHAIKLLGQQLTTIKASDVQEITAQTNQLADTLSHLNTTLKATVKQLQEAQNNPDPRTRTPPQIVKLEPENLRFNAYYPKVLVAETWKTMLVYAYVASALEEILQDLTQRTQKQDVLIGEASATPIHPLRRGTRITIIPSCQGITFTPQEQTFEWTEDWHMQKFRLKAEHSRSGSLALGEISVYAGPILIATLDLQIKVVEQERTNSQADHQTAQMNQNSELMAETTGKVYQKIFASYSHKDRAIVRACREVQRSLGNSIFIDRESIPSGAIWEEAIKGGINSADCLQLFWSKRAANSKYVREEWEYALTLKAKGENFIRPAYWEEPMEPPPEKLSNRHFAYLDTSAFDLAYPRYRGFWRFLMIFDKLFRTENKHYI